MFIRSGIRYDYLLADKKQEFLDELCRYHISGLLKVAPEHIAPQVLARMGKPGKEVYLKFMRMFTQKNKEIGLPQYLVPYFISSHPGCTLNNAIELAEFLRDIKHNPEQVQDFIPTPGSAATAMYYSGIDPESGETVFVARNPHDKAMQRALMQYRAPRNRKLVLEALQKAGRMDLVGSGHKCLLYTEQEQRGGVRGAKRDASRGPKCNATGSGARNATRSATGIGARNATRSTASGSAGGKRREDKRRR